MFNFAEITKDMTAVEILNHYRNLYYAESQVTERGIVANAINDYFKEVTPRAEVAREIFEEIEKTADACIESEWLRGSWFNMSKFKESLAELKNKYAEVQK